MYEKEYNIMNIITRHLVRPADLNHHGTLYGGRIAEWMTEAAFMGMAQILGHTDHAVIVSTKDLTIKKPVNTGTVFELGYEIVATGNTSITVKITGLDMLSPETVHAEGTFIFVTIDENGKSARHHPLGLIACAFFDITSSKQCICHSFVLC